MAPIYESDVAEERWSRTEWNHYELWEKVEQRVRRHNRLWIAATAVIVLALSSIPIVLEKSPKWATLSGTRALAQEINAMKREASLRHTAYRLRFSGNGSVAWQLERAARCSDPEARATPVASGTLIPYGKAAGYVLIGPGRGEKLGMPGLLEEYCYDPEEGSEPAVHGEAVTGFALAPAADLTVGRMDRVSVLLLNGFSAEAAFE